MDLVSAQNYAGYNGFGAMPFSDVETLHKALTAGTGTDHATFSNGRALIVESLESTLMTTTFSAEDIVLFKKLKSNPIFAVVDEWNEKSDYGAEYGVAVTETETPGSRDSTYARLTGQVKFYRVQRQISHVITLMRGVVDAEAEEQVDGTMLLLRNIEKACFFGNSSIIAEEIDGIRQIIKTRGTSLNQINVRGPITETFLQQGAKVIRSFFGVPTDLFLSLSNQTDVDRILEVKHRVAIPMTAGEGGGLTAGAPIEKYRTSYGTFNLNPDVFITEEIAPLAAPIGTAPGAPTVLGTSSTATTGSQFLASSAWSPGTDAGTYWYQCSLYNKQGETAGLAAVAGQVVAVGDGVTLTVTAPGQALPCGLKIFRSARNATSAADCLLIANVAFTGSGQTYVDTNQTLPGSSDMFLLNMSPNSRALSWQQLLPLMKLPLAITGPTIPFLLMLYGYLRITKPKQHVWYSNVRPSDHRFYV